MGEKERDELTEQIIGAAIEVHRILGPGLLEAIYEDALALELALRGLACQRQLEVDVVYKGHVIKGQRLDLLVAGEVVVETKSVSRLPDVAIAQVLSYLKMTGLQRGLLLNFGCAPYGRRREANLSVNSVFSVAQQFCERPDHGWPFPIGTLAAFRRTQAAARTRRPWPAGALRSRRGRPVAARWASRPRSTRRELRQSARPRSSREH